MPLGNKDNIMYKLLILCAFVGVSGCVTSYKAPEENPFEGEQTTIPKYLEKLDFTMDIIRFEDRRRARSIPKDPTGNVIYEYDADQLLSGVSHRLPVLFSKHFGYGLVKPNTLLVEIDLQKLKTSIKTGTISTGKFGRYFIDLEADITVRDTDSSVLNTETYKQTFDLKRTSFDGRSPSSEMDRSRMYQVVEEAVRRMVADVVKDTKPRFRKARR